MVQSILDFNLEKEINKKIKINKQISILDIGCGVGRSLWELSSIFSNGDPDLQLQGIFYSEKPNKQSAFFSNQIKYVEILKDPLLIAKEFKIKYKNKVIPKLFNTNACKRLPIKSDSVDIIYSTNAFHFFDHKIKAIEEMSRILKVGGMAIINIDRTDDGFWSDKLHFPRLHIYSKNKIIDAKKILQNKSGDDFTIFIKKINSHATGKDAYVLKITKHQKGTLRFPELSFDKNKSFSFDNIRFSDKNYKDIPEYKKFIATGITIKKKFNREDFGGYLSSYKLK